MSRITLRGLIGSQTDAAPVVAALVESLGATIGIEDAEGRLLAGVALSDPKERYPVALDGKIYLLGGRWQPPGELTTIEVYDPETNVWEPGPSLDTARGGIAATVLDGRIFVLGGEVIMSGRETLDSVEVLDPAAATWSFAPQMPVTLHGVPAVTHDGAVYVLGGSDRAAAADNRGRVLIYRP